MHDRATSGRGASSSSPSRSGRVTGRWSRRRGTRRRPSRARSPPPAGTPCRRMIRIENSSSAAALARKSSRYGPSGEAPPPRRPSGGRGSPAARVVHVLMGEDDQLQVLDPSAERIERPLELVQRLARVRAGVDQRQRIVLDQVAVDPSDQERRRDGDAVDAGAAPRVRRLLGVGAAELDPLTSGSARAPRRAWPPCPRGSAATPGTGAAAARCSRRGR